jgi:RNA polymerase sigma-70 factor (ECF subfamily)
VEEPTDAAVIATSLAEPAAFGSIFDRHATVLHRYLVRRLGPDDADGMVGEVFRIAFEKRRSYDLQRPLARPWLYGIATNLVAKHRRREARRIRATARLAAQRLPALDMAEASDNRLDARDRWARMADAVAALPEPERDALILLVWETLSYEHIADALDIPIGTVRSRINRARNRLRELDFPSGGEQGQDADRPALGGSSRDR